MWINSPFFTDELDSLTIYLNPTEACQTKANNRKNTGIAGITSTIGRNAV
jgi:hypothetical protein